VDWSGAFRLGKARQVGLGADRCGSVGCVYVRQVRHGWAGCVRAWFGMAGPSCCGGVRHGSAGQVGRGLDWWGEVWTGGARFGLVWQVRRGWAWCGEVWFGR
jgi:hypothetical protein